MTTVRISLGPRTDNVFKHNRLHDRMRRMSEPADETSIDQYLEPTRPARQGLPPTYRMRHDAHYIDELESRRRPAEATQTTAAALAFPTSIPVTFALQDMSQE